ncbi:macrophage mannose receptor 1-like [Misgurnus anguillicaudatus]|uniref:macrophage mannose receptor 1-like n=1 Tax=Misgurnus anguillicaudatus TaxID=75329 RepID=UPI003CCF7B7D
MSWEEALDHCNDSGLLRIESEKDQIETDRELKRLAIPGPVWIGLRQSRLFGFWIWVNGLQVGPWTNWKGGHQPEHQMSNFCGAMEKVEDDLWKWSDKDCRSEFRVLCAGESSYNYTLILQNKTWFEAQEYCRKHYTDLVTIRNEIENELVHNAGKSIDPFWIGLRYNQSIQLSWFDGGQSNYSNFIIKEHNIFTYLNDDGFWTHSNTPEYASALCYESFIYVSQDNMSWEEALDFCNRNAYGLLRIESENDQIETERALRRKKISGPVWIGLRQSRVFGFWIWVNGLHVGPWKGGRQPEHQKSNYCGAMEKVNGTFKWSDKDCRSKLKFVCERR